MNYTSLLDWKYGFKTLEDLKGFLTKSDNPIGSVYSILQGLPHKFIDNVYVCYLPHFYPYYWINNRGRELGRLTASNANANGYCHEYYESSFYLTNDYIEIMQYMLGLVGCNFRVEDHLYTRDRNRLTIYFTNLSQDLFINNTDKAFDYLEKYKYGPLPSAVTYYVIVFQVKTLGGNFIQGFFGKKNNKLKLLVPFQFAIDWKELYDRIKFNCFDSLLLQ